MRLLISIISLIIFLYVGWTQYKTQEQVMDAIENIEQEIDYEEEDNDDFAYDGYDSGDEW